MGDSGSAAGTGPGSTGGQEVGYQPLARRPIASTFRSTGAGAVAVCVRWGVHPDVVSYASLAASLGAAACFWRSGAHSWLLIPAVVLCYVRLWLNMLDGMVALAGGKASRRGEIINELPDRISDVAIFVGAAHSGLCHPLGGYWAALLALLAAYVGTLGQAVAGRREFGGLMSKPWRMVALHAGAWTTLGLLWCGAGIHLAGLTVLDWTHMLIALGCLQTIGLRLRRTLRALESGPPRVAGPRSGF